MPAAAVIPAPIAYIKVVAVKKLVVDFWPMVRSVRLTPSVLCVGPAILFRRKSSLSFTWVLLGQEDVYFEKIRVFKAGFAVEYISME